MSDLRTPLPAPCEGTRAGDQTPGLAAPAAADPSRGGVGAAASPGEALPVASPGPLTPDDIHRIITDAYTPWQASLVFLPVHELDDWHRGQMRPVSGGSAGTRSDSVFAVREDSPRGMCVHLVGYDGTRATWERVGVIGWGTAERLIRDAATPATTKTLLRAVARERKLIAAGQHDQAATAGLAAQRAWAALIRTAAAPVQGELFGAPA